MRPTSRAASSASTSACRFPSAGDLVLLYPKWVPGGHSPRNDIKKVAGFRVTANGRELKWVRDTLDVYAFHVAVPEGVNAIDVDFQYVSPTADNQGRIVATPDMASIEWIVELSMYPAGYFVRHIPGPGVGDRSERLEGRHRASPERPDRQSHRLSGDELRDPGRIRR